MWLWTCSSRQGTGEHCPADTDERSQDPAIWGIDLGCGLLVGLGLVLGLVWLGLVDL